MRVATEDVTFLIQAENQLQFGHAVVLSVSITLSFAVSGAPSTY